MPPLLFLSHFEEVSYKLSLLNALLIGLEGLQNSEVPGATDIVRCLKKRIHCLINNRTKEYCQNFSDFG